MRARRGFAFIIRHGRSLVKVGAKTWRAQRSSNDRILAWRRSHTANIDGAGSLKRWKRWAAGLVSSLRSISNKDEHSTRVVPIGPRARTSHPLRPSQRSAMGEDEGVYPDYLHMGVRSRFLFSSQKSSVIAVRVHRSPASTPPPTLGLLLRYPGPSSHIPANAVSPSRRTMIPAVSDERQC
ncbi:hypothetical protein AB1N83_009433 [Pleurotus pulmonarius]